MIFGRIPAGGCTQAVAPFAGVKVCAAIGAGTVLLTHVYHLLSVPPGCCTLVTGFLHG